MMFTCKHSEIVILLPFQFQPYDNITNCSRKYNNYVFVRRRRYRFLSLFSCCVPVIRTWTVSIDSIANNSKFCSDVKFFVCVFNRNALCIQQWGCQCERCRIHVHKHETKERNQNNSTRNFKNSFDIWPICWSELICFAKLCCLVRFSEKWCKLD